MKIKGLEQKNKTQNLGHVVVFCLIFLLTLVLLFYSSHSWWFWLNEALKLPTESLMVRTAHHVPLLCGGIIMTFCNQSDLVLQILMSNYISVVGPCHSNLVQWYSSSTNITSATQIVFQWALMIKRLPTSLHEALHSSEQCSGQGPVPRWGSCHSIQHYYNGQDYMKELNSWNWNVADIYRTNCAV